MPAIKTSQTVLLTGASGFLAVHVAQQLLQRGITVRGTVRSAVKGQYLDKLFKNEGIAAKWSWVIVEDLEGEGAFDEAVKGVDGIAHTASPFHYNAPDPWKDLINPAINGTTSVLKSALKEPKVQRIVITSSNAAIAGDKKPPFTYSERDWNESSPKIVEELGKKTPGGQSYRASKTLAEKAAWAFVEEKKPNYDIATINPPFIFGPLLHQFSGESALNTSTQVWYDYLIGKQKDENAVLPAGNFIDVRDVAKLHVEALLTPEAGGNRFAACYGPFFPQAFIDYLNEPAQKELLAEFPKLVKGKPGAQLDEQKTIRLDASKAKKTFNWEPIPWQTTVVDMTKSIAERRKEW